MKQFIIIALLLVCLTLLGFIIYQNQSQDLLISQSDLTAAAGTVIANPWFANNPQKIALHSYGPSPRSEDSLSIFTTNRQAFWNNLTKSTNGLEIHILLIDNLGIFNTNNPEVLKNVAFDDSQVAYLKKISDEKNLTITVSAGIGLTKFCDITNDAGKFAQGAVASEMKVFDRLLEAGITIDELNVDGPFLFLINNSSKTWSCASQGRGLSNAYAGEVIANYLTLLQSEIAARQNSVQPKINLVFNLPNERVGNYLEMHWGTTPMQTAASIEEQYAELNKHSYPAISTVVLDYPYQYIRSGLHTMATPNGTYNNCQAGIKCDSISSATAFAGKVSTLATLNKTINGKPNLSFYLNTTSRNVSNDLTIQGNTGMPGCATAKGPNWNSIMKVPLVPYRFNRCFSGQWPYNEPGKKQATDAEQDARDTNFFQDTRRYYNLATKGLPKGVKVDNLYISSWTENPRYNTVYATKVASMLNQDGVKY